MRRDLSSECCKGIVWIRRSSCTAGVSSGFGAVRRGFSCANSGFVGSGLGVVPVIPVLGADEFAAVERAEFDAIVEEHPIAGPVEPVDELDLALRASGNTGKVDRCGHDVVPLERCLGINSAREQRHNASNLAPNRACTLDRMQYPPDALSSEALEFLTERHLATLSLVVSAEEVHVTPVGFTWDDETQTVRVITFAASKKARLLDTAGVLTAAVSQVDGGRWFTLHGMATVSSEPAVCADAVRRYAERYRQPKDRGPDRRVIELAITRIVGRV